MFKRETIEKSFEVISSILSETNTFDTRTEYRVKMTIFEQLKWKLAYYRSDNEYIDISILDSVQKPNSDGILVWVSDKLSKYTIKSPFYNKIDDVAIFIKIAIEFINFIYDMSVKDRRMYAHYIIDGVKYCPWMNPDDKVVSDNSNTIEVIEFRADTNDIIAVIKDILNFTETIYRRKSKEYPIYDVLLLKSRDGKLLHERNIETGKIEPITIDVNYFQIKLFIDKNAIIKSEEKKEEESKYQFSILPDYIRSGVDFIKGIMSLRDEFEETGDTTSVDECNKAINGYLSGKNKFEMKIIMDKVKEETK
jgi:hypothetical protein